MYMDMETSVRHDEGSHSVNAQHAAISIKMFLIRTATSLETPGCLHTDKITDLASPRLLAVTNGFSDCFGPTELR